MRHILQLATVTAVLLFSSCGSDPPPSSNTVETDPSTPGPKTGTSGCTSTLTGTAAFTDYTRESPGVCHSIAAADLSKPAVSSVVNNSTLVARKSGQLPSVPAGFRVQLYATGFSNSRLLATAPNGDIFLADSGGNTVRVLLA